MRRTYKYLAAAAAMLLIIGSCKHDKLPPPDLCPSPVSFSLCIQPIFTANCALSGCHADSMTGGLNLEQGNAYFNLFQGGKKRPEIDTTVHPIDANNSRFYKLVSEGSMPPTGILNEAIISNIKRWIEEGAKNN